MDNKAMFAKMLALQKMREKMKAEGKKGLDDELKAKKMKVVVEAPDKEGLAKGLSKAQELMMAKYGSLDEEESMDNEDSMEEGAEEGLELSDMMEEASPCEECGGGGCPICDAKETEDLEELG